MRLMGEFRVRASVVQLAVFSVVVATPLSAAPKAQTPGQPQTESRPADGQPAGDAAKGKRLYNSSGCYLCHGYQAQGAYSVFAFTAGRRLAPSPMPFRRFVQAIRTPRDMPPYSEKVLSEQDLMDIHAFLRSIPAPPDVNSIPLLAPSKFESAQQTK